MLIFFICFSSNFNDIFGQVQSTSNSTNTQKDRLIVTTELNKLKFIPGESIIVEGDTNIFNQTNNQLTSYFGQIFVNVYELNIAKNESLPGNFASPSQKGIIQGPLIYAKEIYSNGTFNLRFESPDPEISGQFAIVYMPALNEKLDPKFEYEMGHYDFFEVVLPWGTLWGWMFLISILFGVGLIFLIFGSSKIGSFISFEILRFVCISGIVLPIIIGLVFIDSEWGTNSPISIIKLSGVKTQEQLTNQWVIVIGGVRTDNYQSGVLIPIYVLIFGMIGGYLRYLYRTMVQRINFVGNEEIDVQIFNWKDIPGNSLESDKLKQYLISNFDVPWISNRDFVNVNNNQIEISTENKENLLSFILDDERNIVKLYIDKNEVHEFITKKVIDKILVYQKMDKKNWLFYQSLGDLTVLFMAPLLSIITWFILTTGGTYNKYVISTVSLAVGLISDNIINRLINFADTSFRSK